MGFHVFQTGNALFYCNLLNEILLLHISVFRIRDSVIWCVCQNQGGGGVGGVSAVTVYHFRRSARIFLKLRSSALSPELRAFPRRARVFHSMVIHTPTLQRRVGA